MKNSLFIILLFAAGCVLPETRTTVVTQHIFSQEDTDFYFSDCEIKSRADSFELLGVTKEMKFYASANLCKSEQGEVRFTYGNAMHMPYMVQLRDDGLVTITTLDKEHPEQYENKLDTLHFTPIERKLYRINVIRSNYKWKENWDSVRIIEEQNPLLLDSLYFDYLSDKKWVPVHDTITIIKTSFYTNRNDFLKVVARINQGNFWKSVLKEENEGVLDGSGFTLEVKANGKHWANIRNNVDDKQAKDICRMLLKYRNMPKEDLY